VGRTLGSIDWKGKYNLLVLTIIKKNEVKSLLGKTKTVTEIQGVASDDWLLQENDILVLYGNNDNLASFARK
jgi:trk system potassium uptake protein TrkA